MIEDESLERVEKNPRDTHRVVGAPQLLVDEPYGAFPESVKRSEEQHQRNAGNQKKEYPPEYGGGGIPEAVLNATPPCHKGLRHFSRYWIGTAFQIAL